MARVKLSEYDAKRLLFPAFNLSYSGLSLLSRSVLPSGLSAKSSYALKVDQGVKKRAKGGLLRLNLNKSQLPGALQQLAKQGWSQFLLEPMLPHPKNSETYFSLERIRSGWKLAYSEAGGIEIESHWDSLQTSLLSRADVVAGQFPPFLPSKLIRHLPALFALLDEYHLSFVEINPLVITSKQLFPLDLAVEIDSAALTLPSLAKLALSPVQDRTITTVEHKIALLDASTPAALKFRLLNQEGRIWMLLSGGGASLVLADEVADLNLGSELANYGEYSGAPSQDDTYAYAKLILAEIIKLKRSGPKALIIAGGVANFTDVARTFKGLIRALDEVKSRLVKQEVRVYVRRGGPNEEQGLADMRAFLSKSGLLGSVHGSTIPLTRVVTEVKEHLS